MGSAQAGQAAAEHAKRLWSQSQTQRTRVRRHLERYHGAALNPIDWRASFALQTDLPLVWNITRSFVGTVVAHVGASENPKVQFVTSDADWSTRRKARKLDQFVDALALQPCPPYSSIHELRTSVLRDACLFGKGVAQVGADIDTGRVTSERVLPWEILVDTRDARYNAPSQICRAYPMSTEALEAMCPKRKDDIQGAKEASSLDLELELGLAPLPVRVSHNQKQVYELWEMAQSPEAKGRHMLVLDGVNVPLIDEDYDLEYPPFAIIYWDHPIIGSMNHSLADEVAPVEDEINRTIARLADSARRTSLNVLLYKQNSIDVDQLEETRDATCIPWSGDVAPQLTQAEAINESMLRWVEVQKNAANDLSGVSEMAQTGTKEAGLPSAAAQRAVSANQSKRFAWLWRQVEAWQLQWARLAVHAVRTLADNDPKFAVKWPGHTFLQALKWADVDLDDDQFVMQIHAVGGAKNTPADRIERAENLFQRGVIPPASYQAIASTPYDNDGELRIQRTQQEYVGRLVDTWLDATDEELETGHTSKGKQLVPPPLRWINLSDAIVQVALAYLDAEMNGAPDANLQCFLDWLAMADAVVQQQQARAAALQKPQAPQPQTPAPQV